MLSLKTMNISIALHREKPLSICKNYNNYVFTEKSVLSMTSLFILYNPVSVPNNGSLHYWKLEIIQNSTIVKKYLRNQTKTTVDILASKSKALFLNLVYSTSFAMHIQNLFLAAKSSFSCYYYCTTNHVPFLVHDRFLFYLIPSFLER